MKEFKFMGQQSAHVLTKTAKKSILLCAWTKNWKKKKSKEIEFIPRHRNYHLN